MGTSKELRELREQKKALLEKQRELLAKADEGKEERKAFRKTQTEARKAVMVGKKEVRELSAKIFDTFSKGSAEDILELAENLAAATEDLSNAVRSFGEAALGMSKL